MANKGFPDSKTGEKRKGAGVALSKVLRRHQHHQPNSERKSVMSNNKISGIHAIGVEVPELKELMEQLLNDTEVELEKDLDGETRQPEPQSEADKWQRYADMLGDLFDVAHQIGYDAYMQGDLKIMRKVLQVESDVVDLAGIVTVEKSKPRAVK